MEVKGTGLVTTREYVKTKHPMQYDQWLNSLPLKSKEIYKGMVMNAGWYPMQEAYLTPMEQICSMFFHGDVPKAGEELGKFSAEVALTGIYKAFLLVASPTYLMRKASSMMSTYYRPSEIDAQETANNQVTLTIKKFPEISKMFEYRLAGWCKRSLELSKCKNVTYKITKHLSAGASSTEIVFDWQ